MVILYLQYFNCFLKQSELVMVQMSDFIHFASGIKHKLVNGMHVFKIISEYQYLETCIGNQNHTIQNSSVLCNFSGDDGVDIFKE